MPRSHDTIILGCSGLLGQALQREAAHRGQRWIGVSRRAGLSLDLANEQQVETVLDSLGGRTIINAAALASIDACERQPALAYAINARLPAVLAEYCGRRGVKWVQISTDHYFIGTSNERHDEASPVTLVNEYARTKFAAEAHAATCPEALTVRTNIVGFRGWPGQPTFVEWAIGALRSGADVTTYADVWSSSIDVDNFAVALFDLIARNATGLLNVAARDSVSKSEFILALAQALDLDSSRCRIGSIAAQAGVRRANALGLNVERAEHLLRRPLPDTRGVVQALSRAYRENHHATV